jgi:hypothetical protein
MDIKGPEFAGFVGGLLLCAGIVASIFFQVRFLMLASTGEGRPRGLRAFLMILLLAAKTFGAGLGVWLLLVVWRLPLGAFALGLFAGLALTIVFSILIGKSKAAKNP